MTHSPAIVFLIDNSASMNQHCYLGTSLLDVAKSAVETFIKQRLAQGSRTDRYLLVTLSEKRPIVSGWKDASNHALVTSRLKSIQASSVTNFGAALKTVFDLLNKNRILTNIDTYGLGRSPFFLESSLILCLTDGCKLSSVSQVQDDLFLPMNEVLPGSELTKEPFRWDYRMFSLVLRLPAEATQEPEHLRSVPTDVASISAMCDVTGGRSYCVRTHKTLLQCLESINSKLHNGVVIHFEKADHFKRVYDATGSLTILDPCPEVPLDPSTDSAPWHSLRRMIYVKLNHKTGAPIGHWPLPEPYFIDANTTTLMARPAHPTIKFIADDVTPMLRPDFPFDKYELEPSPLTQVLLEKKTPNTCWQVYVTGCHNNHINHPCGYLKASSNLTSVNLVVMPYNYPLLLPLIDQLIKSNLKPNVEWKRAFSDYLTLLPPYYMSHLRKAMRSINAGHVLPDGCHDNGLNPSIQSYLQRVKDQTRSLPEDLAFNDLKPTGVVVTSYTSAGDAMNVTTANDMGFVVGRGRIGGLRPFHNPFVTSRSRLVSHVTSMSLNLKQILNSAFMKGSEMLGKISFSSNRIRIQDRNEIHNQPVSQMGNYQEYLRGLPKPLRELNISSESPRRLHTFGNPFKRAKERGMMVDETEDLEVVAINGRRRGLPKRKRHNSIPAKFYSKYLNRKNEVLKQTTKEVSLSDSEVVKVTPMTPEPACSDTKKHKLKRNPEVEPEVKKMKIEPADGKSPKVENEKICVEVKFEISKLVRKPGQHDHKVELLINKLPELSKNRVICDVIKQAERFKRHKLLVLLKKSIS